MLDSLLHPINDITTTPTQPVTYLIETGNRSLDELNRYDTAIHQVKQHPDVQPLVYSDSYNNDEVWNTVKSHVNQHKWEIIKIDDTIKKIQCIDTTPLMKFKDDIIIELRRGTTQNTIEIRSKSRVGKSDMGVCNIHSCDIL